MELKDFISEYDFENKIILLEGKRIVKDSDKEKLIALGHLLASNTKKLIFRSGNADGSDYLFSYGVSMVNKERLQVITPYSKHREKNNLAQTTYSLDEVDVLSEQEVVYHSKKNVKMVKLIDKYLSGERDRYSIKASYIIRDTLKVTGSKNIAPTSFGIFYDDLEKPLSGGTGHTMNVCVEKGIPFIDQRIWFNWLNE